MGTSQSSRRNRQQQNGAILRPPVHPWMAPPPGYSDVGPFPHQFTPYYYHHPQAVNPQVFQHGYYVPGNGHYLVNQQIRPPPLPPPENQVPPTVPEYQKTHTVHNDVNLNKSTLRLERDEADPEHHLVAFSFDATAAGSITIFFMAREAEDGRISSLSQLFTDQIRRFHFKSGLGQKFKQDSGVNLSLIDEEDLVKVGPNNLYPLIIRIETEPKNPPSEAQEAEAVGGPLRKWIHCQQTYATIEKKDASSEYNVKVVKQIIWVDGIRYELQEIYGIATGEVNSSSNDSGKECVICMSEPKDTTVLPCRHMCMCSGCANVLRYQTNLCPICRRPVEELLQIKVPASITEAGE